MNKFNELAESYFQASYRASPTTATDLGIHEYDHLLDDLSERGVRARIAELIGFRRKFKSLDAHALANGVATDYALIMSDMDTELLSLQHVRDWQRDPAYYVADPFFSIFWQVSHDYLPLAERIESLTSRLELVPELFTAARANLKHPPHVLTEIAIEETEGAIDFCATLLPTLTPQAQVPRKLERASTRAARALSEYRDFLRDELMLVSTGDLGIGEPLYSEILRREHMLDYAVPELVATGERIFAETERELTEWGKQIDPSNTWRDIALEARTHFPKSGRLLGAYRQEVARLRRFIRERELVSLPAQDCQVVETPPFDRALNSFAAYVAPGPFESDQRGQFWVTPIDDSAPRAQQIEQLEEHCNYLYPVTAAHEAYPGHHVQLVRANQVGSRWRKHFSSSLFAEGWALYCEELMNEAGYYRDPRIRLFQLQDRMWRAARVIVEIGVHCYDLPLEDAARYLVDKVGMTHAAARAETRRYVAEPGQPMSYLIGELEVLRLRSKFSNLTLREFHDRLLDSGTIPFALVEKEMEEKIMIKE